MNFEGLTIPELIYALADCPAAKLEALDVLRAHKPRAVDPLFPTGLSRERYIELTTQMVTYLRDCAALAAHLRTIGAQPADSDDADAFGL